MRTCETCEYFDIVGYGEDEWTICKYDPCEENWHGVKETDSCEDWEISEYWESKAVDFTKGDSMKESEWVYE